MSRAAPAAIAVALLGSCGSSDDREGTRGELDPALFVQLQRPGEPLAVIRLPAGEPRIVRGLATAGGDPPVRLALTGGRLVYRGARGAYAIDLDLKGRPQRLGALYFVPSATEGRVWLTFRDHDSPETVRDLRSVAEVTVQGRVTARSTAPPPCRGPTVLAAVRGAVLCQDRSGLRAFDPASGEVLMRLPGPFPLDTHAGLVAWCRQRCGRLHFTDVETGRRTAVAPPRRFAFEETYEGAFSPDGSLLAAPVLTGGRRQVALVDVPGGTARVIAGSKLAGNRNMTWSSSGRWLFFESGRGRIMGSRRGSERATVVAVRLRARILDMVAS